MINKLIKGDNIEIMKSIDENYADLIITSPPYDDLRDYEKKINWNFEIFKEVAKEMFRVLKEGGVCVWVVGDKTTAGNKSLTSFKNIV